MLITLSPEAEARLREKARQDGRDVNAIADDLIIAALEREARDRAEAIEGVRRGDQAAAEGRERPLADFLAEQREKHGITDTEEASARSDRKFARAYKKLAQ